MDERGAEAVRAEIRSFLGLAGGEGGAAPEVHEEVREEGFTRKALAAAAPTQAWERRCAAWMEARLGR